jgi:hypothetical protein
MCVLCGGSSGVCVLGLCKCEDGSSGVCVLCDGSSGMCVLCMCKCEDGSSGVCVLCVYYVMALQAYVHYVCTMWWLFGRTYTMCVLCVYYVMALQMCVYRGLGWPEPYIHTVYDRMYGDFWGWPELYIIYIYLYTVNLAGKSPNIRSYTVYIYGFGQL